MLKNDLRMTGVEREKLERDLERMLKSVDGNSVSRRDLIKRGAAIGVGSYGLVAALNTVTWPGSGERPEPYVRPPGRSGRGCLWWNLRIAEIGEPPTLDEHQTTVGVTATTGYLMYETLVTYDAEYGIAPELAESWSVSEDQLTHTFNLKQGVTFHNGEPFTAADAVASLERWGQISGVGKNLFEATDSLEAPDDNTMVWTFTRPYGTVYVALSHNTQAPVIYPKSVIDARNSLEPNEDAYRNRSIQAGGMETGCLHPLRAL